MISKKENWLLLALCCLAAIGLHSLTVNSPPMFDDKVQLTADRIFSQFAVPFGVLTRWLSYGTFAWTYQLFGENWPMFRVQNVLLHAATVGALLVFYKKLFSKVGLAERPASYLAAGGALLFAVHPITVYAVSYLIQRSIVMATLFSLLALISLIKASESGQRRWLGAAMIAYFLALSSKEYALMLPMVAGAMLYLIGSRQAAGLQRIYIYGLAAFLAALAMVAAVYHEQMATPFDMASRGMLNTLAEAHPVAGEHAYLLSVINESYLFFKYLLLWVLPMPGWLSVDMREAFPVSLLSWPQIVGPLAFAAYAVVAALLLKRGGTVGLVGFGLAVPWLLYPTEFATVWIQDSFVLYRSYFWLIGLPAFLPYVYEKLGAKATGIGIGLLAIALSASSLVKLDTFKSEFGLWDDAVRYNEKRNGPTVFGRERALNERALLNIQAGRADAALADYGRAIELNPKDPALYANRGALYLLLNQFDRATADIEAALKIEPAHPRALYNRAAMYSRQGRNDLAMRQFNEILANSEALKAETYWTVAGEVYAARGLLNLKAGQLAKAMDDFTQALRHGAHSEGIYLNRGVARASTGDGLGALEDLTQAIAINPAVLEPYINRALVKQMLGRSQDALADADTAVSLAPAEARTHLLRAQIYVAVSRIDDALAEYNRILDANPNEAMALLNRGEVKLAIGQKEGARQDLAAACKLGMKLGCDKLAAMPR